MPLPIEQTEHQYGFQALLEELGTQGISKAALLNHAGLESIAKPLSRTERLAIFRAAQHLARNEGTGLYAGARQRVSYYGVYGYALASSATMADAFRTSGKLFHLSGSVLRISLNVQQGTGILHSHEAASLGSVLPFIAEFWRSSQTQLLSLVLGRKFPSTHMFFPFPPPPHAALYSDYFDCPVTFNAAEMEWHFDARVLNQPCRFADKDTSSVYEAFSEEFIEQSGSRDSFEREVLRACMPYLASGITSQKVANELHISVRTLYRRLQVNGTTFQSLIDRLRCSVARAYLENTTLTVDDIAQRCGYQDTSSFRKGFHRWTGRKPSDFRP